MAKASEIELLCPAKDLESGKLAINYGADAVYIGAPEFSARQSAGNPIEDIQALCTYAHFYRAKVYVTLNTILYDNELHKAQKLILDLYDCGVDALIIQDMAILEMELPPIPLFASTQTNNFYPDRIKFLEKTGISRIILARELSLPEIKEIRQNTEIELECFIHGALCVSLSGQCYFSHAISGRSANRGACLQACRMPFDLVDSTGKIIAKQKHLLSLKDLNASARISNLLDAGITSFKIEGRLKDKAYIINNTAYYRKLIDQLISDRKNYSKASSGNTDIHFKPDPLKSFNRGFTEYFMTERKIGMASLNTPKSMGEPIAKVLKTGNQFIHLESGPELNSGDGLCFFDENKVLRGFNVNQVEGKKLFTPKNIRIKPGTLIYRNYNIAFEKELIKNKDKRNIQIDFRLEETEKGFRLSVIDEDAYLFKTELEIEKEQAKDPEKLKKNIHKQLAKTGDFPFKLKNIFIPNTALSFISLSELNSLRRNCLEGLENIRIKNYKREKVPLQSRNPEYPEMLLDYKANISNRKSATFYKKHGVLETEPAFELLQKKDFKGKPLMHTRYCIKYELGLCPHKQNPVDKFKEPLYLVDKNRKYELQFDCKNCMMRVLYT